MNVVLSTVGKFWTFDLARQLHRRGALDVVFSGYPRFKLQNERLPREKIRTFPWLHAPYMRISPGYDPLKAFWEWQDINSFDRHVSRRLPPCNLFCSLSGSGLRSGTAAKKRGAKYVCDRGSAHIRFQATILKEEHERQGVPFRGIDQRVIEREEAEYELADAITVPSSFALRTFLDRGVPARKMKLAPYGVDLSLFSPSTAPDEKEFQVLFVGTVSVRKGISYLVEAFDKLVHPRKRLVLVGPIESNFRTMLGRLTDRTDTAVLGPKSQAELKDIMSASHVMVLPSVEDGFGLVMAQAMACGCPVIASENTGGADLFTHNVEGFITPVRNSDALAGFLQKLADNPDLRKQMGAASVERVKSLGGWDSYGEKIYRAYLETVNV